jgi:hypothetical protein
MITHQTQGPHSVTVLRATNVQIAQLTRNEDCENAILFLDEKVYKITAFVNSANEPQLRIVEIV